jgi:hypothetical protein
MFDNAMSMRKWSNKSKNWFSVLIDFLNDSNSRPVGRSGIGLQACYCCASKRD